MGVNDKKIPDVWGHIYLILMRSISAKLAIEQISISKLLTSVCLFFKCLTIALQKSVLF